VYQTPRHAYVEGAEKSEEWRSSESLRRGPGATAWRDETFGIKCLRAVYSEHEPEDNAYRAPTFPQMHGSGRA